MHMLLCGFTTSDDKLPPGRVRLRFRQPTGGVVSAVAVRLLAATDDVHFARDAGGGFADFPAGGVELHHLSVVHTPAVPTRRA